MIRALRSPLFSLSVAFALGAGVSGAATAQPSAPTAAEPLATSLGALQPFSVGNSQIIPIESKHTGRKHELVVVLPASYAANPDRKYPVFYYLDAYWDTLMVSAVYGNLLYDNQVPEMILVGFSYPAGADYGRERSIDYTPTVGGEGSGKGRQFLDFIRSEAVPLIEARFRGSSADRVIGGSSLAGLFSIAAAYMAPDFFVSHIAISPAVIWDKEVMFKTDEEYAKAKQPLRSRMFVSYGSSEHPRFRQPIERFQQRLAKRAYAGLALQNHVMRDLEHAGVKADGYTRGLIWAWKANKPAGPSGLDRSMGPRK